MIRRMSTAVHYFYRSGCRSLSGTSVASPVVAGAVTLLLRSVGLSVSVTVICCLYLSVCGHLSAIVIDSVSVTVIDGVSVIVTDCVSVIVNDSVIICL